MQRPWSMKESNFTFPTPVDPSTSSSVNASNTTCESPVRESIGSQKVQIGLSAGLGVPLLLSMVLLVGERRKRRQAEAKAIQRDLLPPLSEPELCLDTLCSYEVDASPTGVELSSQRPLQELGLEDVRGRSR